MKIVTSMLNRRAVMALAAASMLAGVMQAAPAWAADVTIPIIVKDTTSFYWQIVLAGARKAGKDLGVKVPELGAQAETDVNGQISILENAVAGNPAAIVISPTEFKALGKPIDEAAAKVKIIGIDSGADSKAFTSFLTTDNVQGGRVAADGLAAAIGAANGGKIEGKVALITALPGAGSLEQRAQGFNIHPRLGQGVAQRCVVLRPDRKEMLSIAQGKTAAFAILHQRDLPGGECLVERLPEERRVDPTIEQRIGVVEIDVEPVCITATAPILEQV